MSKTDKTKPWWVRVAEHNPPDQHDHRIHDCNLPESAYAQADGYDWRDCHWGDLSLWGDLDNCCHGCGCRMCTGYYERLWGRRKSRHDAKALIRRGDWDSLSGRVRDVW